MSDFNDIPKGFRIPTQIPLDVKKYVTNENTLKDLGEDNNLAYTYEQGLRIYCISEGTTYEWRESNEEGEQGLLDSDFTYPDDLPVIFNINYSNRIFNFYLIPDKIRISNLGDGKELYKDLITSDSKSTFQLRTLASNNLILSYSEDGNIIYIDQATTSEIPALYVNNLYIPTREDFLAGNNKGLGTLSKPFTDTITSWPEGFSPVIISNTAIQNALNAYLGDGKQIIVQNNFMGYIFSGNFQYKSINIRFQTSVTCTNTGFILDMDSAPFTTNSENTRFIIDDGYYLVVRGRGFNNSGNSIPIGTYLTGKSVYLGGTGYIFSDYNGANNLTQWLVNSDTSDIGNGNDGNTTFNIYCKLYAINQGVYRIGGNSRIDFHDEQLASGSITNTVNNGLKAFYHTGGQVRFYNSKIYFFGNTRNTGFYFNGTTGLTTIILLIAPEIVGVTDNTFRIASSEPLNFSCINAKALEYNTTFIFTDGGGNTQRPVLFKNNYFNSGTLGQGTAVDLTNGNTTSSVNTIGTGIIETLMTATDRVNAVAIGITKGSAFINKKIINSTALVSGREYQIKTVGSTDYTTAGAASNTVGLNFIASGTASGTGTCYYWTRDILI